MRKSRILVLLKSSTNVKDKERLGIIKNAGQIYEGKVHDRSDITFSLKESLKMLEN